MIETELLRSNELVDPALHIWGWEIPVYLFLGGVAAGAMIVSALFPRYVAPSRAMRWLPFAAPLLISAGMFALFLDLEFKLHVFRFYTAFRVTSPMSWGAWILLLIYPATIVLGLVRVQLDAIPRGARDLLARAARNPGFVSRLETANVVLGVALGAYTGVLLGTLGARDAWSSGVLAPLFLVSGVSTAAALAMLMPVSSGEHEALRRWDVRAIVVELILLALFFIDLGVASGAGGRAAASMFFGGRFTAPFLALVIVAGLLLPLLLEISESRLKLRATAAAPVLLLAGGLALRWIIVLAGQASA